MTVMSPLEFAKSYLGEYTIKGNEITPKYCPFCHGGDNKDKNTFALNIDEQVYKCLRGSCNASGHFTELLRHFGINPAQENVYHTAKVKKTYKKPKTVQHSLTDKALKYIQLRGLTAETADAFGLSCDDNGNIAFPYYRSDSDFNGKKPTFVKFRKPEKLQKGERKMWREADTEPILFGMHLCKGGDTLYLFEGEFDCMVGWQVSGNDCVSVPSGCEDFVWLDTCYEWLQRYSKIAVFADNDTAGIKMLNELSRKLDNVAQPDFALYENSKDCNEIYVRHGASKIKAIMDSMKLMPVHGLINLADVERVDLNEIQRTMTGIPAIDAQTGGMLAGDLTVWTGKRGDGKSTFLGQLTLEAVNQGVNVCVYSGEIPAHRYRYWLDLQAAGSDTVQPTKDIKTDRTIYCVSSKDAKLIEQWYDGKIWLYDNKIVQSDEREAIKNVFELAYKRYDCRVFIIDNLMTVNTNANAGEHYQTQADYAIQLRKLADKLNVHIHLVVHPRKGDVKDSDDVGGLGTITNIACNVFNVKKYEDEESAKIGADGAIKCMKNRAYGICKDTLIDFNPHSRRYTEKGTYETEYGWRKLVPAKENNKEWSEPPF
jgi:twinkle protein